MSTSDSIHSQLTDEFIEDNPRDISLNRFKKTKTTAGGFTMTPDATLAPQRGRLILGSSSRSGVRTLSEGRVVTGQGTIVFSKGVDVQEHDTTVIDDMPYEVVEVVSLPWSLHAEVVSYAD